MAAPEQSGTELAALLSIADKLIASNPLDPTSWDVDLTPCIPIAKAHLKSWSLDQQRRDDRRARGKGLSFHSNKNDGNFLSEFFGNTSIMDSRYETKAIRMVRKEPHTLNRSNNAIANFCAELFLNRTSAPFYHDEPNAYPFKPVNDKGVSDQLKDIWVYLRNSSGTVTASFKDTFQKQNIYSSPAVRIDLFVQTSLADPATAAAIFKRVYPEQITSFLKFNPNFETGLGASVHGFQHPDDKLYVAAMACRGMFSAIFTWSQMNTFLVQGGWPWLRQYPRVYARLVFTTMMLMFAAVENYQINDMNAINTRLLSLAGKLVGDPTKQLSLWKVRISPYLKGPKVTIPLTSSAQTNGMPIPNGGNATTSKSKASHASVSGVPWMNRLEDPPTLPQPLPTHIVHVQGCQHNGITNAPFAGRLKVAHSISELDELTVSHENLTVALTWGEQRSVHEVCAWAVQNSVMAVLKGDNQCIRCAVNLAQCVAALVVIA